jgi:hypothetical protein
VTAAPEGDGEVVLSGGGSASSWFHRVLAAVAADYRTTFGDSGPLGSVDEFKKGYDRRLPRFEAARADAAVRCDIAHSLVAAARPAFSWKDDQGEVPLMEHLDSHHQPLEVVDTTFAGRRRLEPHVMVDGVRLTGDRLVDYVVELSERGSASPEVPDGVGWLVEIAATDGIDLGDRRIVMLGAGAELAPTRLWLEGGADVLWIDVAPPPPELLGSDALSGQLTWVQEGADLLAAPGGIRATVERFAGDQGVDIGLYAYAPGRTREWRLAAGMNAIVDALPPGLVRTVTMLVSPTTCGILSTGDAEGEQRRRNARPLWQAVAERTGLLGKGPGHAGHGEAAANCGIVPIQGASYQAAQYLGKLMAAEAWATGDPPFHVSANTAGISLTESLRHPVFDTAFAGAGAFGVETFPSATTASLNGLLALRDWLDPEAPSLPASSISRAERARAVTATRVHGGIYQLPYPIEPALRVATALGIARDPRRVATLLRRG